MFTRKARRAAYRQGYIDALETLKADLQAEAERRIDDRQPYDLGTLAETVMGTANRLIRNQRGLT